MTASRSRRWLGVRRTSPVHGDTPGTVVVDPTSPLPVITVLAYGADGIDERRLTDVDELDELLGRRAVTWVNVDGLGDARVLERLGKRFGLHALALEDVVHVHQRAKVDSFGDHLYIVARMLDEIDGAVATDQLSLFLGKGYVLTFQERAGDCFDVIRGHLRAGRGRIRSAGPDYLAYALLDATLDDYFPTLERLGDRIQSLEEDALAGGNGDTPAHMQDIRRDLLTVRRAAWPLREALSALQREPTPLIGDETRVFLRDTQDHAVQVMDLVETYREIASGLMELYLTSVSRRLNEIMKVLTIISTIFIPLSFIAGVYGMNFQHQPEYRWRLGYPWALGLMALTAGALVTFFWRRGWLGRRRTVTRDAGERAG